MVVCADLLIGTKQRTCVAALAGSFCTFADETEFNVENDANARFKKRHEGGRTRPRAFEGRTR